MLAYLEIESESGPHGIPMSVATDPRADPEYYGEGAFRFAARPVMDWAQHAITVAKKALLKERPNADEHAYRFLVDRVDFSGGADG